MSRSKEKVKVAQAKPAKATKQSKKIQKNSVQELLGIKKFNDYGIETDFGTLVYYQISPINVSVLSYDTIDIKIREMIALLSTIPDIEILCTDSSECFDENKAYLKHRKQEENNPNVAKLINQDFEFLDNIETEVASARQFVFICRCRNMKPDQMFQRINKIEKTISEQKFEVKRLDKNDLKRFLALYFDASSMGERMPDYDGAQYFEETGD